MHLYQAFIVVMLILITLITRRNSEILSVAVLHSASILMYYLISETHYSYYYTVMCFLLLVVGWLLHVRFKAAAMCSYALVLVNAIGYFLWYKYYPHDLYDVVSAIILVMQFLFILPKALSNGMDSTINRHPVAVGSGFDGHKEYDTMYKISKAKKDQR